jgi:hypothetical protein
MRYNIDIPMPKDTKPPKSVPRTILETEFAIGDEVILDNSDLTGFITGFCWRMDDSFTIEVGWLYDGSNRSAWFNKFRVKRCINEEN